MLIDHLFTIDSFATAAEKISASVSIHAQHKIFEGHFPSQPVLPGVCQIQLVKELLEKATEQKLFLREAAQCKFLQIVNPEIVNTLFVNMDYKITDNGIVVSAVIKNETTVFMKLNALFESLPTL